jgi:hypothetical protein
VDASPADVVPAVPLPTILFAVLLVLAVGIGALITRRPSAG